MDSSKLFSINNFTLSALKLSSKISSGNTFKRENEKPWTTFKPKV